MDRVFARWRDDSTLVWLPERGMGYYPVRDAPYDEGYFQKYARYAATPLGQELDERRRRLIERWVPCGPICDVGIGCGQLVASLRAAGREAYGFDINPVGRAWLEERGWWRDPREQPVATATFFDSLEHMHDPGAMLDGVMNAAIVALPIFIDARHVLRSRHFRKDEHALYFTREGFMNWMREHGFETLEHNTAESIAGREDISTFVLRRTTT